MTPGFVTRSSGAWMLAFLLWVMAPTLTAGDLPDWRYAAYLELLATVEAHAARDREGGGRRERRD